MHFPQTVFEIILRMDICKNDLLGRNFFELQRTVISSGLESNSSTYPSGVGSENKRHAVVIASGEAHLRRRDSVRCFNLQIARDVRLITYHYIV